MTISSRLGSLLVALVLVGGACAADDTEVESASTTAPPTSAVSPSSTTTTVAPTTTVTTTTIVPPPPIPIDPPEGYELTWSDEFEGDVIDPANWTYDIGGWGWGNGEAQYYTDRPENARVENGLLVIELRAEPFEESYYTSARLLTQGLQEFQYGRIEARIKVPSGVGTWPAFWMLGANFGRDTEDPNDSNWPNVGEIDIMEYVGREPDLVVGTIHGPGYAGAGGLTRWNRQDFPIADDFHTFAIDWDEEGIRWFFDDEQYYELTPDSLGGREWVFDQPFFIILNVALGGTLGGMIGLDTEFPLHMYVDYVRVYQEIEG
ncbi:MAG: glycoside hydrolase family 16 protein [Acidimicrobiia bacterium]|nr:glycoside hydrolase family 16 protein [Acidimicrobiia bacterium]